MDLKPKPAHVNRVLIPAMRQIFIRPKLGQALFGRSRWGNPFGDQRYADPYPMIEAMRADGPVVYRPLFQMWFVTGHDEVLEALNDPGVSSRRQLVDLMLARPYSKLQQPTRDFYLNWMLLQDPPDHGRLRRLVSRAFTVRRVAELEPKITAVTEELIADMRGVDTIEMVKAFNRPLPISVIAALVGIPRERWRWAENLVGDLTKFINPFEPWTSDQVDGAVQAFRSYVLELSDQRRRQPEDDLLTALVQAEDDGDRLTTDEVVANVGLLFFAGMDTTMSQLGNSLLALERFPDQRRLVRENPDLWPNAVEELLRFDGPLVQTQRYALTDVQIGGHDVPAGSNIAIMISGGNRDPRTYAEPDRLVLDRSDPRPVTFGYGAHHCLGHALARLELRVGLKALIEELGDYTIDHDRVVWRRDLALRGPLQLVVQRG